MTWMTNKSGLPDEAKREKLLAERGSIEAEIIALRNSPIVGRSNAVVVGRQEDLIALAKKIKIIDRKLGRSVE